jgi:hypothetical protein
MTTEYEQLLSRMIEERSVKAAELKGKRGKEKELAAVTLEMKFLEVELKRYQQGMALFRTKDIPKVGRWGKPEAGEAGHQE